MKNFTLTPIRHGLVACCLGLCKYLWGIFAGGGILSQPVGRPCSQNTDFAEYQILNTDYQILNTKYQMPNTDYQIANTKHQIPNFPVLVCCLPVKEDRELEILSQPVVRACSPNTDSLWSAQPSHHHHHHHHHYSNHRITHICHFLQDQRSPHNCKSQLCSLFHERTCSRFTRLLFVRLFVTVPEIPYKPL